MTASFTRKRLLVVSLDLISETLRAEMQVIYRSFFPVSGWQHTGFCDFRHSHFPTMHVVIDQARVLDTAFCRFPLSNLNFAVSLAASHHGRSPAMSRPADLDRSEAFPCSPEPIK